MKKSEIRQIIKEEILKEIKFIPPSHRKIAYAWAYENLYLDSKAGLEVRKKEAEEEGYEFWDEGVIELKPGMIQMIYWIDSVDGENVVSSSFNSKEEYIKNSISWFWGEDQIIHSMGIENEIDAAGDNWKNVFNQHIENNIDLYFDTLNNFTNRSHPGDGDSGWGVALLMNGKLIAGNKSNIRVY